MHWKQRVRGAPAVVRREVGGLAAICISREGTKEPTGGVDVNATPTPRRINICLPPRFDPPKGCCVNEFDEILHLLVRLVLPLGTTNTQDRTARTAVGESQSLHALP